MSRPRYRWWGYAKNCIRDYPELDRQADASRRMSRADRRDLDAVRRSVERTMERPDGPLRVRLVGLVYWEKSHSLAGAALKCCVSYSTARRWHAQFVRSVGEELGLLRREKG